MKRFFLIMMILGGFAYSTNAQDTKTKTEFNKTLKAYFDLKNALATDNVNQAGIAAQGLSNAVKTFPIKTLTPQQQLEWAKQVSIIGTNSAFIVKEKELKTQRKNFEGIAAAMVKLVKEINLNAYTVYVQYCPMAKKGWLNEVEEVQNPFFGSKMYDCGEVTTTIAKK